MNLVLSMRCLPPSQPFWQWLYRVQLRRFDCAACMLAAAYVCTQGTALQRITCQMDAAAARV